MHSLNGSAARNQQTIDRSIVRSTRHNHNTARDSCVSGLSIVSVYNSYTIAYVVHIDERCVEHIITYNRYGT